MRTRTARNSPVLYSNTYKFVYAKKTFIETKRRSEKIEAEGRESMMVIISITVDSSFQFDRY